MNNIDLMLDLNPQAYAVLAALAGQEPEYFGLEFDDEHRTWKQRVQTFAWYNGRERGFRLVFRKKFDPGYLTFCVAENRNSDQIVVYMQEAEGFYTNPHEYPHDAAFWKSARYFPELAVDQAVSHIRRHVQQWVEDLSKRAKRKMEDA